MGSIAGKVFGAGASGAGAAAAAGAQSAAAAISIPRMNNGGRGRFGGLSGIDRNILSLNGQPIARVSRGEAFEVTPANQNVRSGVLEVQLKSPYLEAKMRGIAGRVVNEAAPAIGAASRSAALADFNRMQDDRLE